MGRTYRGSLAFSTVNAAEMMMQHDILAGRAVKPLEPHVSGGFDAFEVEAPHCASPRFDARFED